MNGIPVGFALARCHARFAARPAMGDWRDLSAARTPAQYLHYARQTGLEPWLRGVTEETSQIDLELKLRTVFRHHVREVADWLPEGAVPAAHWIGGLPDLPALAYLHRGGAPQPWMDDDPLLVAAIETPPADAPCTRWLERWQELWPGARHDSRAERLGRALRGVAVGNLATSAAERLHWLFRTRNLDVAGVYAYLGLVLDDLRRLAGGLARRRPGALRHAETA